MLHALVTTHLRITGRRIAIGLRALAAAGLIVSAGAGGAAVRAAPDPAAVPTRWQLDTTTGPLRVSTHMVKGVPTPYFYLTYTVTNNSGQDVLFAPAFELVPESGDAMRSGRDVPLEVTRAIVAGLGNPFIQDQISIIGQMLQGKENAREGVVIWPVRHSAGTEIAIYSAGFSGETAIVDAPDGDGKVVLRKTLMLRYRVPGSIEGIRDQPLELIERRWVMR